MTKYTIRDADYLDLWKYFQGRADSLKESMFQIVTWVLGFAAAVLGFVLTSLVTLEASTIVLKYRRLAVLCCFLGVGLCLYALFVLREFAKHIRRNWNRAHSCELRVEGLIDVINPPVTEAPKTKWEIWNTIGVIVVLFALAFIVMAIRFAVL